MTIANNIIALALRTSGVLGIGQTAQTQDTQDAFTLLNDQIDQWNAARAVAVIPGVLPIFPDLTTDVPGWTHNENVLVWNLSVRLRTAFGLPEDEQQTKIAMLATQILQANNLQQQPPDAFATVDTTGFGLVALALRAAGRVTDAQGILTSSQDASDGVLLLREMLDEWQLDRTVTVTPGTFPVIGDPTATITVTPGLKSAIVWNLAVRMRAAFGADESKNQNDLAAKSLAALQANNKQQQPAVHVGDTLTAIQVIFLALRMAGRINDTQSVTDASQDVSDALALLNNMLALWSKERWLVYDLKDVFKLSTGAQSYTIGPGGDIDCPRPDRIESAFVRMGPLGATSLIDGGFAPSGFDAGFDVGHFSLPAIDPLRGIDYPLEVLQSREDYNVIALKGLVSFPTAVFLDSDYPLGTISVYPVPAARVFEIHLSIKATLPDYATLTTTLGLPPEYREALVANLACRIVALVGGSPSTYLLGLARASLKTIRSANLQIGTLSMPSGLLGIRGAFGRSYSAGGFISPGFTGLTNSTGNHLVAG